jgi:hypothetical protein
MLLSEYLDDGASHTTYTSEYAYYGNIFKMHITGNEYYFGFDAEVAWMVKRIALRVARRKASKFKRVSVSKKFKDRFQKFYYLHRPDLNKFRRSTYTTKKKKGICVKCKKKALSSSIFCAYHLRKSRVYNSRR